MGGTTAPLTLAGLLAVQHAELLMGLVLTQLAQPGCPFLYGGTSSVSSMRSGALLMGAPEYWPWSRRPWPWATAWGCRCAPAARSPTPMWPTPRPGPSRPSGSTRPCGRGPTSSCTPPASCRRSTASRPPSSCSTTSCSARCAAPIGRSWSTTRRWPSTSSAAAGPGGSLLGQAHTRRHAREAGPDGLMNRDPYETWRALGSRDLAARADARVAELLAATRRPTTSTRSRVRQLEEYCLA